MTFSNSYRQWQRWSATLAICAVLATACGSSGPGAGGNIPPNFPTIAPAIVNGQYEVVEAVNQEGPLDLEGPLGPTVAFDVVTGELSIEPICNQFLGSFTLDPGGRASFTVTGGSSEPCPSNEAIEDAVIALFDSLDQWSESEGGLTLTGPGSQQVELRRI